MQSGSVTHTELNKRLIQFLWEAGYSHFITKENPISKTVSDDEVENIFLLPIKPGDLRHQFEEAELIISHFDSLDVQDMLLGADGIRFVVELPVQEYRLFEKSK